MQSPLVSPRGLTEVPVTDTPRTIPLGKIISGVVLGVAVVAGMSIYSDTRALIASLRSFHGQALIGVLLLTAVNWALRFLKWHFYLRLLGAKPKIVDSGWVFVAGFSMGVTPGKFGELLKAWLLEERSQIPLPLTASVVVGERLTDFIALVLLAAWGVYATGHGVLVMVVACTGSVLSLLILSSESTSLKLIRLTAKLPVLSRLTDALESMYLSTAKLVKPFPLIAATVVSTVAWGCECIGFYLVLNALPETTPDLATATFIYSFATIFGAITLLPGGLGTTEGSLVGLTYSVFALASKQAAVAGALLIRFCTLWAAVIVGVVVLLLFRRPAAGPHH